MICKMFTKKESNPGNKRKILIAFDDMTADMINNKRLNPVVPELFIRGRNLVFLLPILLIHTLKCRKMLD